MATKTSTHRLRKELRNIMREPPPHITARPLPNNILKWYFVLEGPTHTPYAGGLYLGRLTFPEQYPYKPPAVYMCTPQGRFKCEQKLCLSMSDFHPETWNPLWSVSAVLTGLLSFMLGDEDTVGSIQTSVPEKRALARASHAHNRSDRIFVELFPEFVRENDVKSNNGTAALRASSQQLQQQQGRAARGNLNGQRRTNGHGQALVRRGEREGESLVSLLAWLVVFLAVIFGIFRLITRHHDVK